jgi:hypothetical protein
VRGQGHRERLKLPFSELSYWQTALWIPLFHVVSTLFGPIELYALAFAPLPFTSKSHLSPLTSHVAPSSAFPKPLCQHNF